LGSLGTTYDVHFGIIGKRVVDLLLVLIELFSLRNCAVDFVEICNVYIGKMIIKAAKRIFNSDKIWRIYSDLNFGVTFLKQSVDSLGYISLAECVGPSSTTFT